MTINTTRDYEGASGYTYAEVTMRGTVARPDGSTGNYAVPVTVIYPKSGSNGVGVVDWINSAFYHFFEFAPVEFATFQFTLISTGSYLFEEKYTYASVQWNKAVTEIFGATAPNDGQPHNHMVYGTIERSADAWEIFLDAARLLKNPQKYPGSKKPKAVGTVLSSGYSQGGGLQNEMLVKNFDPTRVYDGHLLAAIGLQCWTREDVAPHYGFLGDCSGTPNYSGTKAIALVTESDMSAFKGFQMRNNSSRYRQYELAGVSHLPKVYVDVAAEQNPADPTPVFRAAIHNLQRWVRSGWPAPPSVHFEGGLDSGGNFVPVTGSDGNWKGGLRLPHVESRVLGIPLGAPLGVHQGINPAGLDPFHVFIWLGGTFQRYSDEELEDRYPSRYHYVSRVRLAAYALDLFGYILPDDRDALIDAAKDEPLPGVANKPYREDEDPFLEEDLEKFSKPVDGGCSSSGSTQGAFGVLLVLGLVLKRRRR